MMHRNGLTQGDIVLLKTLATDGEQGHHFTEQHSFDWIDKMEERGYIVVDLSSRIGEEDGDSKTAIRHLIKWKVELTELGISAIEGLQ